MRSRPASARGPVLALAAVLVLLLAGCGHRDEVGAIPPLPAAERQVNPGLGPEARPLTSGPGYKNSPSWSPDGDRVAFIVDGYVADRTVEGGRLTRWTTRDFVATDAEWTDDALLMLGDVGAAEGSAGTIYRADSGEESLSVEEVAQGVLEIVPEPQRKNVVLVLKTGREESGISLLRDGRVERIYTARIPGVVTGASAAPDGDRVALAVRPPGRRTSRELSVFDLRSGEIREVFEFDDPRSILGDPQWTDRGIYFVAGVESAPAKAGSPYDLYRAGPDPGEPEPAAGVGEDFVASSARVSPDGERLAVVGRLNPKSPLNLHILDFAEEGLTAMTTNEDMEIKTGPDDLAWSPAGTSVAIVARGASTGEPAVRAAPADRLLDEFYNLYEVPVSVPPEPGDQR